MRAHKGGLVKWRPPRGPLRVLAYMNQRCLDIMEEILGLGRQSWSHARHGDWGSSSARPKLNRTGKSASCCSLGLRPSQQLAADQLSCIAENKYLRGASSKTHHPVSSRGLVVEIEAYVLRRGAFAHNCRYLRSTSARTENIRSKSPQYAASDSRSRIER